MKKFYLLIISIVSFLGISSVKADQVDYRYSIYYYNSDVSYISFINNINNYSSEINSVFSSFMTEYEDYKNSNPYYIVNIIYDNNLSHYIQLNFYITSSLPSDLNTNNPTFPYTYQSVYQIQFSDRTISHSISLDNSSSSYTSMFIHYNSGWVYVPPFFSNFDIHFTDISQSDIGFSVITASGVDMGRSFLRDSSSNIPSIYDLFEFSFLNDYVDDTYTTYDLNNYSYVILSFKDYDHLISPTYFDVKGQFCVTSVYDYGQVAKDNVTDICSVVYSDFAPVRLWTSQNDFARHVVYYLKAYDTSISNLVKINTSIYNVFPITATYSDNPTIYVNGRPYSPLPYDDLPTTATGNTSSGFVPGNSCAVGDVNCYYESTGIDINDLFTHPLDLLQSVWGAITGIFSVIAVFISLLPPMLQGFMFTAFMLAVVLGILKIIIG